MQHAIYKSRIYFFYWHFGALVQTDLFDRGVCRWRFKEYTVRVLE